MIAIMNNQILNKNNNLCTDEINNSNHNHNHNNNLSKLHNNYLQE